jgi:hypothetical protein
VQVIEHNKSQGKPNMNGTKQITRKTKPTIVRVSKQDNALMLKPEYRGQPVVSFKIKGTPVPYTTAVTSGQIAQNVSLSSAMIYNFATRFQTFTEFRIVKVKATMKNFSSLNPGIGSIWFSEDDSTSPGSAKAISAFTKQFNYADQVKGMSESYVPHDPAQQTWTLVSSGAPVIGYFKHFTNATDFGSSAVATAYGCILFDVTVQFRGMF